MAVTTIFTETALGEFVLSEIYGYFFKSVSPAPFSLAVGETYTVVWGPDTFEVTAQDSSAIIPGTTFIGNGANYGFPSNDEPFAIVCSASDVTFFAVTDTEPNDHTIAIYHGTEDDTGADPEDPPEGIVLKDRNGKDVAYYGIETVTFDTTTEGKQQVFTKGVAAPTQEIDVNFADGDMPITAEEGTLFKEIILKKPDSLDPGNIRAGKIVAGVDGNFIGDTEEITVDLNMANGDQVIVPTADGRVISKVTVKKPETMVEDNIADGVDLGGLIGTHKGGGAKVARGSIETSGGPITVEHGLGVIPDVVIVWNPGSSKSSLYYAVGISKSLTTKLGLYNTAMYCAVNSSGTTIVRNLNQGLDATTGPQIHNVTETSFSVADSTYPIYTGLFNPSWIAIGGLTE